MLKVLRIGTVLLALTVAPLTLAAHSVEPPTAKQLTDFNRIDQSLNALSEALTRIGEEKRRQDFAKTMNGTALEHQTQARQLLESGHPDEAREQLDLAMVAVKTAIATLRNRETLVRSLNFDNPADEYQYELDRFHSYSMLVNLLLEQMKPDPHQRLTMEKLMEQAWERETVARGYAEQQEFSRAIGEQEQSNKLLLQAIRRGGIYVPG